MLHPQSYFPAPYLQAQGLLVTVTHFLSYLAGWRLRSQWLLLFSPKENNLPGTVTARPTGFSHGAAQVGKQKMEHQLCAGVRFGDTPVGGTGLKSTR